MRQFRLFKEADVFLKRGVIQTAKALSFGCGIILLVQLNWVAWLIFNLERGSYEVIDDVILSIKFDLSINVTRYRSYFPTVLAKFKKGPHVPCLAVREKVIFPDALFNTVTIRDQLI